MISEYFLLSLMLSIQYVYERFLLVFSLRTFVLKAAAKVQLLFFYASFFEKKISFFSKLSVFQQYHLAYPLILSKKPFIVNDEGFSKERRRHTLPQIAVPSAQSGLTSLFGMGRGEPRRNNHLKSLVAWATCLLMLVCQLTTINHKPIF